MQEASEVPTLSLEKQHGFVLISRSRGAWKLMISRVVSNLIQLSCKGGEEILMREERE